MYIYVGHRSVYYYTFGVRYYDTCQKSLDRNICVYYVL